MLHLSILCHWSKTNTFLTSLGCWLDLLEAFVKCIVSLLLITNPNHSHYDVCSVRSAFEANTPLTIFLIFCAKNSNEEKLVTCRLWQNNFWSSTICLLLPSHWRRRKATSLCNSNLKLTFDIFTLVQNEGPHLKAFNCLYWYAYWSNVIDFEDYIIQYM